MKARILLHYFPSGLRYTWAVLSVAAGVFLALSSSGGWVWALVLLLSAVLVFTTCSEIVVDLAKGLITSSFKVLMIPMKSHQENFTVLNQIRLDKERVTYTSNSAMGAITGSTDYFVYHGLLEYDDGKEFTLLSKAHWQVFIETINDVSRELKLEVYRSF